MTTILRIYDKFQITGRGVIYSTKNENCPGTFCIGDIFYDLSGSRFKVTGIEMPQHKMTDHKWDENGIMLENLDGKEVQGSLLVNEPPKINFLFCNHPLYQKKVDEDYSEEFSICSQTYPCALFSYEDLEKRKLSLYGTPIEGITIYRGWMMKPEMYSSFYEKLKKQNIILINSPEEYNRFHLLPNWYHDFENDTAKSAWTAAPNESEAFSLLNLFQDSVVIKDYVKSRKHEWYDACFIPQVSDTERAHAVIHNFISRQGEGITGGIVIREFLALKPIGHHDISGMPISEEYRAFIFAGKILVIDNYWNEHHSPTLSNDEQIWLNKQILKINSNFVTIDFARKMDGSLIIMELGDGQVSGLQQIPADVFYNRINDIFGIKCSLKNF